LEPIRENEIPFELPKGWEWYRLGNTGLIYNGNSLNAQQKQYYSNNSNCLPYVSTKHVGYGSLDIDYTGEINIPYNEPNFKIAHSNSVLICSEGGSAGRKIGLIDRDICFGNKLYANEIFSGITAKYIYYVYQSPFFFSEFKNRMTGIIGGISINNFTNIPIPLPPTVEQKRIVVKVDSLMALCGDLEKQQQEKVEKKLTLNKSSLHALNNFNTKQDFNKNWDHITKNFDLLYSTPENVNDLKQMILQFAVQGKLVPQDPNDESVGVLLEKIKEEKERLVKEGKIKKQKPLPAISKDEKSFELPKGWEWTRLDALTLHSEAGWSPKCESTPRVGENWGVLKVSAVTWERYNSNENKALPSNLA